MKDVPACRPWREFLVRTAGHSGQLKLYTGLNLCMLGSSACFFLWCADFFFKRFFEKFNQEHYQCVKQFGSRSGPTKDYQQTAKVTASRERVIQEVIFYEIT